MNEINLEVISYTTQFIFNLHMINLLSDCVDLGSVAGVNFYTGYPRKHVPLK